MRLRFFFDNGCCLWIGDEEARARWEAGPVDDRCGLSPAVLDRIGELSAWHDNDLNPDDPGGPGLWDRDERGRFERAARGLLTRIREELGPAIDVVDRHDHDEFGAANQTAARFGAEPGRIAFGPGVTLTFRNAEGLLRVINDSVRIRIEIADEAGWIELFSAPVWNSGEEGFDDVTGLDYGECLEYGFELLTARTAPPRTAEPSPSKQRRSRKHCPVCAAPLDKIARRTRLMRACDACHARPSPGKRCRRCDADELWENKGDAGCMSCGLHGPKLQVVRQP